MRLVFSKYEGEEEEEKFFFDEDLLRELCFFHHLTPGLLVSSLLVIMARVLFVPCSLSIVLLERQTLWDLHLELGP